MAPTCGAIFFLRTERGQKETRRCVLHNSDASGHVHANSLLRGYRNQKAKRELSVAHSATRIGGVHALPPSVLFTVLLQIRSSGKSLQLNAMILPAAEHRAALAFALFLEAR